MTTGEKDRDGIQPGSDNPSQSSGSLLVLLFLALACSLVAFFVQYPYRTVQHAQDDMYFLFESGLARTGRQGTAEWLFRPYNGHHVILWKILYEFELRLFGFNTVSWHAVATAVHTFISVVVYLYLRRFLKRGLGPTAAAFVWSGAAIGHWDNPLIWLSTVCIAISIGLLLTSLLVVDHMRTSATRTWDCLLFACTFLAVLNWSIVWILSVVVPVQFILMVGRPTRVDLRRLAISWLLPFAILGIIQLSSTVPETMRALQGSESRIANASFRTMGQLGTTFGLLTVWNVDEPAAQALRAKILSASVFLLLTGAVAYKQWRVLFVAMMLGSMYLFLVNLSRPGIPLEAALAWGRYAYLPTLCWCLVIGVFLDAVGGRLSGWGLRAFIFAMLLVFPFYLRHQRQIAASTARQYNTLNEPTFAKREEHRRVLLAASMVATQLGRDVRLPEVPMNVPPVAGVLFPLSGYLSVWHPDGLPRITVVPLDDWSRDDRERAFGIFDSLGFPEAKSWVTGLRQIDGLDQKLVWLSALASERSVKLRIPNEEVAMMDMHFPVLQFVAAGYRNGRLPNITHVAPVEWTEADRKQALDILETSVEPLAAEWRRYFEGYQAPQQVTGKSPPGTP